jgi:hypothetical protein
MLAQYEGYGAVQRGRVRETAARKAVRSGESKTLLYTGPFTRIRVSAGGHLLTDLVLTFGAARPVSNRIEFSIHTELIKSIDGRGNRGEVILS